MEGGGMRGLYTAGVIDVLMENEIYADSAVGVSAGAVFGCNYKSRQIGRVLRYNKKYCKDKRLASIRNWITTGDVYSREFGYYELPLCCHLYVPFIVLFELYRSFLPYIYIHYQNILVVHLLISQTSFTTSW